MAADPTADHRAADAQRDGHQAAALFFSRHDPARDGTGEESEQHPSDEFRHARSPITAGAGKHALSKARRGSLASTSPALESTVRPMGQAKNKKQRECPAQGGIITPEECGRGRNSRIACPLDCAHNPFAPENFGDAYLPLEIRVLEQVVRKLSAELTPLQLHGIKAALDEGDYFTTHSLHLWLLLDGDRLAKWREQGAFDGWKNDERVLLDFIASLRPGLVEFREVLDATRCHAVDLLQPGPPFVLFDPWAAAKVGRHEVMFGWFHELPGGRRAGSELIPLPPVGAREPREVFQHLLDHLGAPAEGTERWLMEHAPLVRDALLALDVMRFATADDAPPDPDLLPPDLIGETAENRSEWDPATLAATAVAALDGKSPRAAAADPALRPRLLAWMKGRICGLDALRRTRGLDLDLNPLLAELGLDELILPPPPLGIVEEEEAPIPLDPPPRQPLLEGAELEARFDRVIGDEALWNRLDIRLADLLDAFNDLSDKLNATELEALQTSVVAALGALHPEQPPAYEPSPERMLARYDSWIHSGDDSEMLSDYLDRIFAETRQPELCECAVDLLFHLEKDSGKKLRQKKLDALMTAVAAAIWEAAHWPPVPEAGS